VLRLKIVRKQDCLFLYQLLKERNPIANISHKKMPSYSQHVKFVTSKPYSIWCIIYYNEQEVGSIYLSKQNEIGIFVKKEFQKMGFGTKALQLFMKKYPKKQFLANINPKNKNSIKFFKENNFKLIQHTYEHQTKTNR